MTETVVQGTWEGWSAQLAQKFEHAGFPKADATLLAQTNDKWDMFQNGVPAEEAFQMDMLYREFIADQGDVVPAELLPDTSCPN